MILRRSPLQTPSIIVFAAISGVVGLLALGVGTFYFLRCKKQKTHQQRQGLRHSARFENLVPLHVPVDALPPHMRFGYPENSLFPQTHGNQDGGQCGEALSPISSTQSSSQLKRPSTQLSQYQLPPIGFSYANHRSGVPPVHIPATPSSGSIHTHAAPTSTPNSQDAPMNLTMTPASNSSRTTTPKPLPPLTHTVSRSRGRSCTPTPLPRGQSAFSARGNPYTLTVIPATPLVHDTRPPGPGGDASSSGSDYSQLSDPEDPRGAVPSARGASPPVRVASPPARVLSPPVWFRSTAARHASPAPRPLPPAISLPGSSFTSGRTRYPSLHAHFTPRREETSSMGAQAQAPALPTPHAAAGSHPSSSTDRAPTHRHLGSNPTLHVSPSTGNVTRENDPRITREHGVDDNLTDPPRAYFPPNLTRSPLSLLERDLQSHITQGHAAPTPQDPHDAGNGSPGTGWDDSTATPVGESTSATEETTDSSTSHGEATNVAFVANSFASKTWAQRCAEDGRFRNKFEALVASEVSEGSLDGGKGRGGRANPPPLHTPYGVPGVLKPRDRSGSTLQIPSPLRIQKKAVDRLLRR